MSQNTAASRSVSSFSFRPPKKAREVLANVSTYQLDLSEKEPPWLKVLPLQLEPRIPIPNFYFLLNFSEDDFALIRPDELPNPTIKFEGWNSEHRRKELDKLRKMLAKSPSTRKGDDIVMTETYDLAKSRFPGRIHSGGLTSAWGVFKNLAIGETASDLDMEGARQCIMAWVCAQYGFNVPEHKNCVENKNAVRAEVAREEGVTVKKAKELINAVMMSDARYDCKLLDEARLAALGGLGPTGSSSSVSESSITSRASASLSSSSSITLGVAELDAMLADRRTYVTPKIYQRKRCVARCIDLTRLPAHNRRRAWQLRSSLVSQ